VAIAYVAGLSAVLMLYSVGGRRVMDLARRKARGHTSSSARSAVVLLVTGRGDRLQPRRPLRGRAGEGHELRNEPAGVLAFLVDPTHSLENSKRGAEAASPRCAPIALRHPPARGGRERRPGGYRQSRTAAAAGVAIPGVKTPSLPDLGAAPNFTDNQDWFNTPGDQPLTMAGLRGHVVIVDFWTYTCINCIRTLPFLKALYADYHRYGLEVVGVETPEFTFEQEASNVEQAIQSDGIRYPVVQDNDYGTWNAYQNEYWPADYLIDAKRRGQAHPVRRGRLQAERGGRPRAAVPGRGQAPAPADHGEDPDGVAGHGDPRDLSRRRAGEQEDFSPAVQSGVHSYAGNGALQLNEAALKGTGS
jgi:thiol-disulfide isomerase/thioredoxin